MHQHIHTNGLQMAHAKGTWLLFFVLTVGATSFKLLWVADSSCYTMTAMYLLHIQNCALLPPAQSERNSHHEYSRISTGRH
ncbi:hypothetical protein GQ54DRAFT_62742 [Martensiomyces pterosporus]|nr:hypothetical protein GQ54DRAFT_62742 [Martensiomyces pterosporus]